MLPKADALAAYAAKVAVWQQQYGDYATCPVTGLLIPKAPRLNVEWRQELRARARTSEAERRTLYAACRDSFMFWLNGFVFTYHQKWVNDAGDEVAVTGDACHVPFISWKIQDEAALKIIECIRLGEDVEIDKSRDMGASWLVLAIFQHFWQFTDNVTFLELSRKELYVDQRGNMDSLFEKHRYMLRMQPLWLRPKRLRDNAMVLENQDRNSSIIGESTNEHAGQGGRKTAILVDEAARIRNLEEIDLATADTAACRIFNSTVNGPATHYTRIYRDMQSGARKGTIIELPWEAHPDKGRGLSIIDVPITPRNPLGKKAVSPYYILQQKKRSARDVAQNLDRDHGKSGDVFFDPQEIEAHRLSFQGDPLYEGVIQFDDELTEDERRGIVLANQHEGLKFIEGGYRRPWKIWAPLVNGRPIQTHRYVFGVDISMGSGTSNSVISVFDEDANQKIAEFADAFTVPEDLAWVACMAGVWFGGVNGKPLLIWETNGPGVTFTQKVQRIGYSPLYFAKTVGVRSPKQTEKLGWSSSTSKKEMLLGDYRDALKAARFINPCKQSLDECLDYVYNDTGLLVPARSTAEAGGAAATHGDRVVADALCELGRKELPSIKARIPAAPYGSYAFRRDAHRQSVKSEKQAWAR